MKLAVYEAAHMPNVFDGNTDGSTVSDLRFNSRKMKYHNVTGVRTKRTIAFSYIHIY